ncbi:hypothetical protein C943_01896 [Mariniradius saccharolyticus AK6]|uniref:FUSC family protein n=1 Tax=Mariniradius saccharolyticus AK6 TaxID=1239962 RepID=M7X292_9BACT|nr:hypothetical protein [Mariniradius saccharolyticus]EMS31625.1 hypothetical protein C943_01896 [Mariniradius saccharolyticus AK6]
MPQRPLSELTDSELLKESKKLKSIQITNAFLVGFLIGIIVFSVMNNSLGFLSLIPLYLIYKIVNGAKYEKEELKRLLKERNLK